MHANNCLTGLRMQCGCLKNLLETTKEHDIDLYLLYDIMCVLKSHLEVNQ
jgi:hypothetical protein